MYRSPEQSATKDNEKLRSPWNLPLGWGPLVRELLVVIPLYVVLALVFTFPLVLNFSTYLIGDLESDIWKHVWGMWWTHLHLVELGTLPLSTHLLNAPYGGSLFFIDPLNAIISVPLQFFLPMPVVYNLMVLFNIVLAAVGAFCLTRYLSGNRYAAFVGGTIYAFSAYMMAYINSGVTEAINFGWIPLFLLFFIRMLQRNSKADAVRSAVFFSCATLGSWYYGAFCVLLGTFYYIYFVTRLYRRPLSHLYGKLRNKLVWPGSAELRCAIVAALAAWFGYHYLNLSLQPFEGNSITWAIGFWGLFGIFVMGLGWMRPLRPAVLGAWWLFSLPLFLMYSGASFFWFDIITGGSLQLGTFMGALGLFVVLVIGPGLWLFQHRRSEAWLSVAGNTYGAVVGLAVAVVGLLGAYFSLFVVFQTTGTSDNWGGLLMCAAAIVLIFVQMHRCLRQWSEAKLESAVLGAYVKTLRDHIVFFAVLSLLSVPVLSRVYPASGLIAFTALFAAVHLMLLALTAWALGLISSMRSICCEPWESEELSDREVAKRWFREMWHVHGGAKVARRVVWAPLLFAVVAGVLIAGPTSIFNRTINGEDSLVFRKRVAHSVDIHLSRRFRNISNLSDYFCADKTSTNRTYTVDKLTRVSYAGWVTLILAGLSLTVRRRQRNFWILMALIFMMFSLGPYLYITPEICTSKPSFIYMAFFNYFPAFAQIAIPYRFVAVVMLCLAVLCSLTLSSVLRTWSRKQAVLLTVALVAAILFENAVFSPAPYPIPLSEAKLPAYCADIANDPDDVGLIDYPIQRYKGELLPGEYFYYQMTHRKDLPNRVEGTIPLFVYQNAFTNYLFVLEHAQQDMPPQTKEKLQEGLMDLARFRFRYLVIHNNLLRSSARLRLHTLLRYYLGEACHYPQDVDVYTVPPYSVLCERFVSKKVDSKA